ncbi:energy transducer TonB [Salinicola acroporae]|uniref:Protein TonB n=1 Tax=Salinicola acroporae TaxID=1541440 RepID=A0ABT6I5R5_9GAMM|nr:energy transducer TonB [Salinicola acroporae]MDH4573047.1 iron transporter [Salinicola acroporae]
MRRLAGLAGGALLALLLFYLLALLVAPPAPDRTQIVTPTAISMVDAPQQDPAQPTPTSPSLPPPSAPPPPPAAAPPPAVEAPSPVEIPEPQMPPMQTPDVTLDETLPELSEARPEPEPRPEPEARPTQETVAETAPQPEATPEATNGPPQPSPAPQQPPRGTQASPRDVGQLQPTSRVNPTYPMRARRRGMEGYVEVSFIIQPDGRVDTGSLRVIDADPANVFDRAVEEAVSQWRFPPADDVRRATQRIQFQLEG